MIGWWLNNDGDRCGLLGLTVALLPRGVTWRTCGTEQLVVLSNTIGFERPFCCCCCFFPKILILRSFESHRWRSTFISIIHWTSPLSRIDSHVFIYLQSKQCFVYVTHMFPAYINASNICVHSLYSDTIPIELKQKQRPDHVHNCAVKWRIYSTIVFQLGAYGCPQPH